MGSMAVKGLFSLALQSWLMNVKPSELRAQCHLLQIHFLAKALSPEFPLPLCGLLGTQVALCVCVCVCSCVHLAFHVQVLKGRRELCFDPRPLLVLTQGVVQRRS